MPRAIRRCGFLSNLLGSRSIRIGELDFKAGRLRADSPSATRRTSQSLRPLSTMSDCARWREPPDVRRGSIGRWRQMKSVCRKFPHDVRGGRESRRFLRPAIRGPAARDAPREMAWAQRADWKGCGERKGGSATEAQPGRARSVDHPARLAPPGAVAWMSNEHR